MNLHLGEDRKIRGGGEGVLIFVLLGGKKKVYWCQQFFTRVALSLCFQGLQCCYYLPASQLIASTWHRRCNSVPD